MSDERIDDGGPAMPTPSRMSKKFYGGEIIEAVQLGDDGMSLRDYFAAHSPIQLSDIATEAYALGGHRNLSIDERMQMLATLQMEYADAMLIARKVHEQKDESK